MKARLLAILLAGAGPAVGTPVEGEAELLYRHGRYEEAAAIFQQRLAAQPDDAVALFHLGKLAIRRADYAEAIAVLERAVALAPREAGCRNWLGNAYAWAAASAPLCDKSALGRKCLAAYRDALDLDANHLPARLGLMNFYRHVPRLFGGGLARAYAEAEEIHRRDPVQGGYARAVLLAHEEKTTAALAALDEVLRAHPAHYAANFLFGRTALASGERLDEGAAALRRCLELQPADTDERHEAVAWCLGQIAERRAETAAARVAYETSLRHNPRYQPAAEALARLR